MGDLDRTCLGPSVIPSGKFVIWLTGLSGSGKTTIAELLRDMLLQRGAGVVIIDGDELRRGVCRDLGYDSKHRAENVRRAAELGKLLRSQGYMVIIAMISPFIEDRWCAAEIIGSENFFGCYCAAPLDVCESRDPKGLYKSARSGSIRNFTGLDSAYEAPDGSYLRVETGSLAADHCAEIILESLMSRM